MGWNKMKKTHILLDLIENNEDILNHDIYFDENAENDSIYSLGYRP